MTNDQLKEMKEVFKEMEGFISRHSSVGNLFGEGYGFNDVLTKAYKYLGLLENEWILQVPGAYDSREAIRNAMERIDVVQYVVSNALDTSEESNFVFDRLKEAKGILSDVNIHLNGEKC